MNPPEIKNLTLNKSAKDYIPRKIEQDKEKIQEKLDKLNFNLEAEEYKPRNFTQTNYEYPYTVKTFGEDDDEVFEDLQDEELDLIVNDIIENDAYEDFEEEESDDEKWFPKFQNCECCRGFIYKCKGVACINMGVCYCKMKEECDM